MAKSKCSPLVGSEPLHDNKTLDLLLRRRSLVAAKQCEPGPSADELQIILRCATRVPDHAKLAPWRIQVVQGEARAALGEKFAQVWKKKHPESDAQRVEQERARSQRSPLLLIVSTRVESNRVPRWEQVLSGGALCQNILIAAAALGYAGQWLSQWVNYDDDIKAHLGVAKGDEILGFIYIGSASESPSERLRPELSDVVSYL